MQKFHLDNLLTTLVYLLSFVDSCARLVVMLFSSMMLLLLRLRLLLLLLLLIIIAALHLKSKVCDHQQHLVEHQGHSSNAAAAESMV